MLEFQLNPGNSGSPLTTAAITGFASDGRRQRVPSAPRPSATSPASSPTRCSWTTGSGFADYFHPFTYGTFFSFYLTLSLPTPNPGGGVRDDVLVLDVFGSGRDQFDPRGGGPAFTITWTPAAGPGEPQRIPVPTLIIGLASVPEPSSVVLLAWPGRVGRLGLPAERTLRARDRTSSPSRALWRGRPRTVHDPTTDPDGWASG